jgi:hypothetical protein
VCRVCLVYGGWFGPQLCWVVVSSTSPLVVCVYCVLYFLAVVRFSTPYVVSFRSELSSGFQFLVLKCVPLLVPWVNHDIVNQAGSGCVRWVVECG